MIIDKKKQMLQISEFIGETAAGWFQVKDHPNCSGIIIALNSLDLEIIEQNTCEGVTKHQNLITYRGGGARLQVGGKKIIFADLLYQPAFKNHAPLTLEFEMRGFTAKLLDKVYVRYF